MRYESSGICFKGNGPYWLHRNDMDAYARAYGKSRSRVSDIVSAGLALAGISLDGQALADVVSRPEIDLANNLARYALPTGTGYMALVLRIEPGSGNILPDGMEIV